MFIGHYGPAVWDTQRGQGAPIVTLWQGFIAVQAIDIVCAFLTIFGIEGQGVMADGAPVFNIPWSHSLLSSIVIALFCGCLFRILKPKSGMRGFWVITSLVFSHWVLDLIVHRPDLPFYPGGTYMMGFSIWNFPWLAYGLEMGLLLAGFLYWRSVTISKSTRYSIGLWAVFLFMACMQYLFITKLGLQVQAGTFDMESALQGPSAGFAMLFAFGLLTALMAWVEQGRPSRFASKEL